MKETVVLIVLDGWGIGREDESNPIHVVHPENFRRIAEEYPMTSLQASGISVGLPWGEVGNSEVGHLTMGAGKVLYQHYPRITMAIEDGSLFKNPALLEAFAHAKKNGGGMNFAGLLSDGNVHASIDHVEALIRMAEEQGVEAKLHLFADGKDVPPHTLEDLLSRIPRERIGTLMGRYYGMDREENWKLTEQAYACLTGSGGTPLTGSGGTPTDNPEDMIKKTYEKGISEEFLIPLVVNKGREVRDGDALFFFNFREDSIRQIAESFIKKDFAQFPTKHFQNLYIATMTHYRDDFKVPEAFPPEFVTNPLGKIVSDAGKTQLRIAETYKYAHITYFFNGYHEEPFKNEYRVLIPSEKNTHPDTNPTMMAPALTDRLTGAIEDRAFDFILANYANPDTIGHTGNYEAGQEAARVIDREIGRILQASMKPGITVIITSDHGNLEEMIDPMTAKVETQHDPSPVPFHLISEKFRGRKFVNQNSVAQETAGMLSDVAPTILEIMGLQKPQEMTGRSLLGGLI